MGHHEHETTHAGELVPRDRAGELVPHDSATLGRARRLIEGGTPEETKLAYARDLRYLEAWADAAGLTGWPMHPDVVVRFITEHLSELPADVDAKLIDRGAKRKAGAHSVATVERRVSTIASYHRAHGNPSPTEVSRVGQLLKAGRRLRAKAGGQSAKRAATLDVLDAMLRACGDDLIGVRDRALLLFAWASGGRNRGSVVDVDGRGCYWHGHQDREQGRCNDFPHGRTFLFGHSSAQRLTECQRRPCLFPGYTHEG